jgi:branched-subunit amino acid aminotransferase/4-amino-4-deoxychorismate lyase
MLPIAYQNGEYLASDEAKLHVSDLSILRGYGVFDYFRYLNGRPRFLQDHLDRFRNSAREMNLSLDLTDEALSAVVQRLIIENKLADGGIRFVMTGGYATDGYTPGQPNLLALAYAHHGPDSSLYERGCKVLIRQHQRQIPWVKTTDYVEGIRLLPLLKMAQADYPLYINQEYQVLESDRSNVFAVRSGTIITAAEGILAGITRKHLIQLAKELGIPVKERPLSLAEFLDADEAIIASSTKGALPIVETDRGIIAAGKVGPVTNRLMAEWPAYCLDKEC